MSKPRQSEYGKGDFNRSLATNKFRDNYDKINWRSKTDDKLSSAALPPIDDVDKPKAETNTSSTYYIDTRITNTGFSVYKDKIRWF